MRHLFAAVLLVIASAFAMPVIAQLPQPGDLVAARAMAVPEVPTGMQAWQIRYWTTKPDDRDWRQGQPFNQPDLKPRDQLTQATGIVIAPRAVAPARPRRVIAWTHGAWGVAEKCAPSLSPNFFAATAAIEAVREGYIVVAPDYPGLGSINQHPFLVGPDTARSVLDAVRAVRKMAGMEAGSDFAVWGESQGGHAALWTASEAKSYAPELNVVGTAAAAPPTDLAANLREGSDKNARALLLSFALHSWSTLYGFSMDDIASRANQGIISRLALNNCVSLDKKPKLGTILGIVTVARATRQKDIATIEPWGSFARANSADAARVPGPLLIAQSRKDTIVAPSVTRKFAKAACRRGTEIHWIDMSGDHGNSARESAVATLAWIDARFNGTTPPNDCRRI